MKCPHCGKKVSTEGRPPSPRERAFVAHYVTNGQNGTEAARSAGFKGKNDGVLASTASRLLRRVQVQTLLEQASLPTTELVMQVLREVGLKGDQETARVAAARVLARIEGMIAPTKHLHAHMHAHLELPAAGTPEAAAHALRSVRALVRLLTPPQRALLLDDLTGAGEVPALPSVREANHADGMGERERTGEAEGGGPRLEGASEGPS